MLMRKHAAGAKICSVTQPGMERLLDFELDTYDAMGVPCKKHLIVELMGRYSNIILVGSDGIVIDCLKRIDGGMGETRAVLPGLFYRLPEMQGKREPLKTTREEFMERVPKGDSEQLLDKWLLEEFLGLSPLICREIVCATQT